MLICVTRIRFSSSDRAMWLTLKPLNAVFGSNCVFLDVLRVKALIACGVLREAALTLIHHCPIFFDDHIFGMTLKMVLRQISVTIHWTRIRTVSNEWFSTIRLLTLDVFLIRFRNHLLQFLNIFWCWFASVHALENSAITNNLRLKLNQTYQVTIPYAWEPQSHLELQICHRTSANILVCFGSTREHKI